MEKAAVVPQNPQKLMEFHLFPQLPAELRLEIYKRAIEPRIKLAIPPKFDPSLAYFAYNWGYFMDDAELLPQPEFQDIRRLITADQYWQLPLERYGFTSSRPNPQGPWNDGDRSTPTLDPLWLLKQPYVAWWFWHESELYSKAPIPVLLHVCRESRYELMKLGYRKAFGNRTHEPMTWFHFDKAVLNLERHHEANLELHEEPRLLCQTHYNVGAIHSDDLLRVRRLALEDPDKSDRDLRDLADLLNLFGWGVEELFYVEFLLDEGPLNDYTDYWGWCRHDLPPPPPKNHWDPEGPYKDKYEHWWTYCWTPRAPWQMTICEDIDYVYTEAVKWNDTKKTSDPAYLPWAFSGFPPRQAPIPQQNAEQVPPHRLQTLDNLRRRMQPWKENYKGRDIWERRDGSAFRALRQCLKEGLDASVAGLEAEHVGQEPNSDDDDDDSSWQPHDFGENEDGLNIPVRRIANKRAWPFVYGEPQSKSGWKPEPQRRFSNPFSRH
ncbi:hypothetical protein V8F33_011816 [Rhypophila sp. PSN 637]